MRKQAQMTMRCMQALVRVQGRVRARRLQLTHEKHQRTVEEEQHHHPMTNVWDYRRQSSHKIKEKAPPHTFNRQVNALYANIIYELNPYNI